MTRILSPVCSHANWFLICYNRLFSYWTHSHLCIFPLLVHPFFLLLVGNDCEHFLSCKTTYILLYSLWYHNYSTYDLVQPKTSTFSTHALIRVHFKVVHWFYQPIFILFSHLNGALHNLVIELCSALEICHNFLQLFSKVTRSFVAIELLTFFKNEKFQFLLIKRALNILDK